MPKVGIRKLKNSLSRYVRRAEAGERVLVTDRGRVVAALVPVSDAGEGRASSRYDELLAAGVVHPARQTGPMFKGIRTLRLRPGTAARLIDEDRGER